MSAYTARPKNIKAGKNLQKSTERRTKSRDAAAKNDWMSSILLSCSNVKLWMTIVESWWNVWFWLVGVVSNRKVWLVGVGGIYGCG